jgi:hypothetical protein
MTLPAATEVTLTLMTARRDQYNSSLKLSAHRGRLDDGSAMSTFR